MTNLVIVNTAACRGSAPAKWEVVVPRHVSQHRTLAFCFGDGAEERVTIEPGPGYAALSFAHVFEDERHVREVAQLAYMDDCGCGQETSTCMVYP